MEDKVMEYESIEKLLKHKEPWKYNFEFECGNKEYEELDTFERYFTYRASKGGKVYKEYSNAQKFIDECAKKYNDLKDPDAWNNKAYYDVVIEIYERLWNYEKDEYIEESSAHIKKNPFGNCCFGGDTMNSVQYVLNDLYALVEEQLKLELPQRAKNISENYIMECVRSNPKFCETFLSEIAKKDINVEDRDDKYIIEQFIDVYHTLGNFVLVPKGFNGWRGSFKSGLKDYWDLSLKYLQENEYGDFSPEHFTKYINYFFLWDYVKPVNNSGYEINPIGMKALTDERNISDFFKAATALIEHRGILMTTLLRLKISEALKGICKSYFDDIQGEEFLSTVHKDGFKVASEKLKKLLQGNKSEEAKQILSELSKLSDDKCVDKEVK